MTIQLMTLAIVILSLPWKTKSEVKVYKKDGDLIIGGLIMVHGFNGTTQTCGDLGNIGALARMEAMAYAVSKLYNDSNILDGFELGYEIYDTCASTADTVRHTLSFIPPTREEDNVIGIVGPQRSTAAVQMTNILSIYNISMISFLATSDELSNSQRYPYFLRTVPPDTFQVSAMTDILLHYGWKYVAILYSDDAYGKNGEKEFFSQAREKKICIAYSRGIPPSATDIFFNNTLSDLIDLREGSLLSVVVLFILREDVGPFFKHAFAAGIRQEFIWIGSDGWGNFGLDPLKGSEESAVGAFTLVPKAEPNPQFSSYFTRNINSSSNPWVQEFVKVAESRKEPFPQELPSPSYESIVIDSVEVFARGLDSLRKDLCDRSMNMSTCRTILLNNRKRLRDNLLQVMFTSASGNTVAFTEDGDSEGRYDIQYLIQMENGMYAFTKEGSWLGGALEIGNLEWYLKRETSSKGSTYNVNNVPKSVCRDECGPLEVRRDEIHSCCWTCETCEDHEIIKDNQCVSCFDRGTQTFMWPNHNLTRCVTLDYIKLRHEIASVAMIIIASLGVIAEIVVTYLYLKNRDKRLIKASSRELGYIILVGVLLLYLSAILHSTPPLSVTCILRRIIPNIGTAFIYIPIGTMTIRLHRIFRSGKRTTQRAKFISPKSQVLLTLSLSIIPLVWGIIWIFITPPNVNIIEPTKLRKILVTTCETSRPHRIGQLAWDLFVVLICCVFAFKTRNLPANYNQSRFIAFCVFSSLVVVIAFAPAFFKSQDAGEKNLYTASGNIIESTVVLLLIFVGRLYALYFVNEEDQQLVVRRPSTHTNERDPVKTVSEHIVSDKVISSMNVSVPCQTFNHFSSQTTESDPSYNCIDSFRSNGTLNTTVPVKLEETKGSLADMDVKIYVSNNDAGGGVNFTEDAIKPEESHVG